LKQSKRRRRERDRERKREREQPLSWQPLPRFLEREREREKETCPLSLAPSAKFQKKVKYLREKGREYKKIINWIEAKP
jgi:hypothetical protein